MVISCGTVEIKNQRWYGDMGEQGAVYFETLTDEQGELSKPEWDKLRFGMVCSVAESFANTKLALEELCKKTGDCIYIKEKKVQKFFNKIEDFKHDGHF